MLATTSPVVVAPAMNTQMFLNPITRRNIATLQEFDYFVVDPDSTADKKVLNRTVSLRDSWAKIEKKLGA